METKIPSIFPFVKGHNPRTVKMMLQKFKLDLCFVVMGIRYKFHKILLGQTKVREQKQKFQHFVSFVKGHNFRTMKLMPTKFKLDLCFMVKSIVYKFHNIWLRQTKVRELNHFN